MQTSCSNAKNSTTTTTAAFMTAMTNTAGLSIAATARATGLSPDAVRVTEARALHKLRHGGQLQDYVHGTSACTSSSRQRWTTTKTLASKKKIWESPAWDTATATRMSSNTVTATTTTKNAVKRIPRIKQQQLLQQPQSSFAKDNDELVGSSTGSSSNDRLWFF